MTRLWGVMGIALTVMTVACAPTSYPADAIENAKVGDCVFLESGAYEESYKVVPCDSQPDDDLVDRVLQINPGYHSDDSCPRHTTSYLNTRKETTLCLSSYGSWKFNNKPPP
ncbi:hypothetical protein [Nocardia sp. NPDC058114]|uniref:LppU/SCO3897 family protein n=1 Tax=Nocardia sp. NPDC058114 TaxID=3346346 RepID=UPI0036DCADF5